MRIARIQTPNGPRAAVLQEQTWLTVPSIFDLTPDGESYPLDGTPLLAPSQPRVVVGMAHNAGPEHRKLPRQAFLKSARTVIDPGQPVRLSPVLGDTITEGELVLVIGKTARDLTAENALEHVYGYTIGNDVTATGQFPFDDKWTQAKNGDGFTPIGPWIETDIDPFNTPIKVYIDDELKADSNTSNLAWNIVESLVYLTSHMTLGPGDIVLTGAPFTAVSFTSGQRARVEIEGIGSLESPSD
jgi:2-keto-4-pentenoate hydratase/2-oxohepta-3-ene-1,7-dioic acid hydratase in catechol pathway